MRSHSHLNTARHILSLYDGSLPLAPWLKQYFRQDKKFGSRDRRTIAHLCYSFFRLGHALADRSEEERILTGSFLSSTGTDPVISELKPEWLPLMGASPAEKSATLGITEALQDIFPWKEALSPEIDPASFNLSFLQQPDLFLRIRPGREGAVKAKLQAAGISFSEPVPGCLSLPNGTRTELLPEPDREAVIQDLNSQRVLEPLQRELKGSGRMQVWDCCAASGGKSILMADRFPGADLTVSDVRASIIHNLKDRFSRAGIRNYVSFVADIGAPDFRPQKAYDVVICDAPCSGSGTWGRTPEQLFFFKREKVDHYAGLQGRISLNAAKGVKQGGYLVYITCSVFTDENERIARLLAEKAGLSLLNMRYFKGYEQKADTLYTALFRRD